MVFGGIKWGVLFNSSQTLFARHSFAGIEKVNIYMLKATSSTACSLHPTRLWREETSHVYMCYLAVGLEMYGLSIVHSVMCSDWVRVKRFDMPIWSVYVWYWEGFNIVMKSVVCVSREATCFMATNIHTYAPTYLPKSPRNQVSVHVCVRWWLCSILAHIYVGTRSSGVRSPAVLNVSQVAWQ